MNYERAGSCGGFAADLYGGDNLHHQKKHVRAHDDNQYKLPSIKSSLSQKVIDGRRRLFERF